MKVIIALCLVQLFIITAPAQPEKKLVILHTNDLHSRLMGYGPESQYSPLTINDDKTVGGFARIATVIKKEGENSDGNLLVLDDGDFLMGTLFAPLEETTGFQLQLMKKMGYDVTCIGNHEFDNGPGGLAEMLNKSTANGPVPTVLLSNVIFDKKNQADDLLENTYTNNILRKKVIITRNGIKTGIFSLIGKDADKSAPYAPPVKFAKQSSFAKKMVKELQSENCDLIICLSHAGIVMDEKGQWTGEDVELAEKVQGIDVIISGHTHIKLDKPVYINDVPIVQAGDNGQYVGRLEISFKGGKIDSESYNLLKIDDSIPGDADIQELIEKQKDLITSRILTPLGLSYNETIVESSFQLECNERGDVAASNLGPLVADAIHYYINKNNTGGTDLSMVAVGVIRDRILPGIQTVPDIFRVMSLGSGQDIVPGYPLSRLYVTGKELKSIIEILQIAYKSTPANYCYYSGIGAEYNPGKGMLKKVQSIKIINPDGSERNVDFSRKNKTLYSISANSYMLEFIGIIKKMSFGIINVVPKDIRGIPLKDMKSAIIDFDQYEQGVQEGKEWLALIEFMRQMKDVNNDGIPDVDQKYKIPVITIKTIK
jgi:5'-nucleotidase/UDP-sugar diphosphatase